MAIALMGAIAFGSAATAAQLPDPPATCNPSPSAPREERCGRRTCQTGGVTFRGHRCGFVRTTAPGQILLTLASIGLIVAWFAVPPVLVYRAAAANGLRAGEITWGWLVFGAAGMAWNLARQRAPTLQGDAPPDGPTDIRPYLQRAIKAFERPDRSGPRA